MSNFLEVCHENQCGQECQECAYFKNLKNFEIILIGCKKGQRQLGQYRTFRFVHCPCPFITSCVKAAMEHSNLVHSPDNYPNATIFANTFDTNYDIFNFTIPQNIANQRG